MSVTQSSRGSASGYQVVHRSREFRTLRRRFAPVVVPVTVLFIGGIFAFFVLLTLVIALRAFFLGWLGSVTGRPPSDPARFAQIQVRALTGVGAERGGHS